MDIDAQRSLSDTSPMFRLTMILCLIGTGCSIAEQPKRMATVAAYEVSLPTAADKARFTELLSQEAEADGFHVDAANPSELAGQSRVSPITFNASIWRGDDEETMATAMDFEDRIGRVWISFPRGQDPDRSTRFREALVVKIKQQWPDTASLPIMPNGAIPLTRDLVRTTKGYVVNPSAAAKYDEDTR